MPWGYYYPPKPSVSERRAQAARDLKKLQRAKGPAPAPIVLDGRRKIVDTFWGKAWCDNIEAYQDMANRLPRGKSYVRHNQVIDLNIASGAVEAKVSGSSVYQVTVTIKPLPTAQWRDLVDRAAGQIDSMVALLQGTFSKSVMEMFCAQKTGLFPSSRAISFACSCPDYTRVCKHVAAVMYGIGVRLDEQPELLFRLRGVDESELLQSAAQAEFAAATDEDGAFADDDLSALFGIELDLAEEDPPAQEPAPADAAPPALLHEALMVALIGALMGAARWSEIEAFASENQAALLELLPLEDNTKLPPLASLRVLASALDADRIERWRLALTTSASRRYRPDNRLRRGLDAALAIIPRQALREEGGRLALDGVPLSGMLSLLATEDAAGVILGADNAALARAVADGGGTYYALAGGALAQELSLFFHDASALDFEDIEHVEVESGERRLIWVEWVDWLEEAAQWPQLSGIIMLQQGDQSAFYLSSGDASLAAQALDVLRVHDEGVWLAPYAADDADLLPKSLRAVVATVFDRAALRSKRQRARWQREAKANHRALLRVLGA